MSAYVSRRHRDSINKALDFITLYCTVIYYSTILHDEDYQTLLRSLLPGASDVL